MATPPTLAEQRTVRTMVGTALGAGGLALCLTLVFLAMRRVMEVGGACASGGPYVIATPCPKGVAWMMTVGIFGGMVSTGLLALTAGRGPKLWALAWPALFLSLGWNFWEFGLDPPGAAGTSPEWIVCGVLFALMGGIPLVGIVGRRARAILWGERTEGSDTQLRTVVLMLAVAAVAFGIALGTALVDAHG